MSAVFQILIRLPVFAEAALRRLGTNCKSRGYDMAQGSKCRRKSRHHRRYFPLLGIHTAQTSCRESSCTASWPISTTRPDLTEGVCSGSTASVMSFICPQQQIGAARSGGKRIHRRNRPRSRFRMLRRLSHCVGCCHARHCRNAAAACLRSSALFMGRRFFCRGCSNCWHIKAVRPFMSSTPCRRMRSRS